MLEGLRKISSLWLNEYEAIAHLNNEIIGISGFKILLGNKRAIDYTLSIEYHII
ncbi:MULTISPECIES: hypothetical protein [Okeania]|uniref:hypothetical protein n=1 Tax=Okeania TaxID=1458928 RepID=UPI001374F490|nr:MULTISPECIES: hypothetical protein [Okeania]NET74781.1 hypothetical protein [Okeania sp. SIO1F9]